MLIKKHVKNTKGQIKRYLIGFSIILSLYLILILLYIYPYWPIDITGWCFLILVGIPIAMLFEFFGESIFNKKVGSKISNKSFSLKRIGFSLCLLLILIIGGVFLWNELASLIGHHFKNLRGP